MAEQFTIRGLDGLEAKLAQLPARYEAAARRAVADTVLFAEVEIADKIDEFEAVDTGRLKGSPSAKRSKQPGDSATAIRPGGLSAVVGTNVPYAIPVHEGYTRQLKGKAVKAAYGVKRGRYTKKRIESATKASKRQANLKISQGTYSRDHEGSLTLHVAGRPFMAAAVPAIEERFGHAVEEHVGRVG